jgi:hypothetical protein
VTRRQRLWLGVLGVELVAVLLIPSAIVHVFNGLPFSSLPEFAVIVLLLPVMVMPGVRRVLMRLILRRAIVLAAIAISLTAALAAKIVLSVTTPEGFLACYRSTVDAPTTGPCERAYANPWFRWSVTRVDRALSFGPNDWNLSFVNSNRFNWYDWEKGSRVRGRFPFTVTWRGQIQADHATQAQIRYVGEGAARLGTQTLAFAPSFAAVSVASLSVPAAGHHDLEIRYTFDDGHRTGGSDPGPYATFTAPGLHPARPTLGFRLAGRFVDLVVAMIGVLLIVLYGHLLRRDAWWALGMAAGGPVVYWMGPDHENVVLLMILVLLLLRLAGRHRPRGLLLAGLSVLYLDTFRRALGAFAFETVVIRAGGDDWLTYESLGRSILETGSLEGGERVFYYQPLARYISFLGHLLLGDGDPPIAIGLQSLLIFAILWAVARIRPYVASRTVGITLFDSSAICCLALAVSPDVVLLTRSGASEVPSWIALPFAIPLLFWSQRPASWPFGAGLLGLSFLARANQGPALLFLMAILLLRRGALVVLGIFVAVSTLPLMHNLYYGRQFVATTTSADISANLDLPLHRVAQAWRNGPERRAVTEKLRLLGHVGADAHRLTECAFHGLQLMWGVSLLAMASRPRPVIASALLLAPLLYLGVHVIYQVNVYYPRHLVVAYLAMGLGAMLFWAAREHRFAMNGLC